MRCSSCGFENPERAKFCCECGTPFAARCARCGTELRPAAKFCLECGADLRGAAITGPASRPEPRMPPREASTETRKIISIIFADLMGSTALQERLDPE